MEAYCPRCNAVIPEVDQALLQRGKCVTCGGQINIGGVTTNLPIEGAIAMTFTAGSRIAIPSEAHLEETRLSLDGGQPMPGGDAAQPAGRAAKPGPPPPPAMDDDLNDDFGDHFDDDLGAADESAGALPAHLAMTAQDETMSDDRPVTEEHTNESDALGAPAPGSDAAFPPPPPDDLNAAPSDAAPSDEAPADEPAAAAPEIDTTQPAPEAPEGSGGATEAPQPQGAHLQLPEIDFSMPGDLAGSEAGVDDTAPPPVAEPSGELPAHLNLPSFPDFALPPIPGVEEASAPKPASEETEGSEASAAEHGTDLGSAEAGEMPAVGAPEATATPPPAPPPLPPARKPQPKPKQDANEGLPDLPAMALPSLAPSQAKKDPTLLQSEAAEAIVAAAQVKRSRAPFVLVGFLVLLVAGLGFVLWWYGPETVVAWVGGEQKVKVELTKRDKAEELLVIGAKAFKAGESAEKEKKPKIAAKKYREAIRQFKKALVTDPSFGKVHRNLGSALAKASQQAKAVEHYERYLEMVPNAADAGEVKKIISDWKIAQAKRQGKSKR